MALDLASSIYLCTSRTRYYGVVSIGFLAYELPLWACIAIALLPPMIIVLVFRLLPLRPMFDDSARAKYQVVQAMLTTAFVFSVTLSINTVWSEDQQIYNSANKIVQTNLAILDQVEYAAPDDLAEGQAHFTALLSALPHDIDEISIAASSESKEQMHATQQWISSLTLPSADQERIDRLAHTLQEEWYQWLVAINASGLPDIIWMSIAVLAVLLLAAVSIPPLGKHPALETVLLFAFGLAVGILQVPLWVLNSQGFADLLAGSVFNEFSGSSPSVARLVTGITLTISFAVVFFVLLRWVDRRRAHRQGASSPSAVGGSSS